jgi:hypothetical protein
VGHNIVKLLSNNNNEPDNIRLGKTVLDISALDNYIAGDYSINKLINMSLTHVAERCCLRLEAMQ